MLVKCSAALIKYSWLVDDKDESAVRGEEAGKEGDVVTDAPFALDDVVAEEEGGGGG